MKLNVIFINMPQEAIDFHEAWQDDSFTNFPLVGISEISVGIIYDLYKKLGGKKQQGKGIGEIV